MTDTEIIDAILEREGGYVDIPEDRGGPTNRGITLPTLTEYLGRDATLAELQALTEAQGRDIYEKLYIERPGFRKISDDWLRGFLVDSGVNSSPERAIKWLQRSLGVHDDGIIGPVTLAELDKMDVRQVRAGVVAERARHYGRLITKDHSQAKFAAGWANRLAEFIEELA